MATSRASSAFLACTSRRRAVVGDTAITALLRTAVELPLSLRYDDSGDAAFTLYVCRLVSILADDDEEK